MALAAAVKGARYTAQQITWSKPDGSGKDLTGATLTGTITNEQGTTRAIDGTLSLSDAANGVFTWAYGSTDVGTAGVFTVQFIATYPDSRFDRSLVEQWQVAIAQEAA